MRIYAKTHINNHDLCTLCLVSCFTLHVPSGNVETVVETRARDLKQRLYESGIKRGDPRFKVVWGMQDDNLLDESDLHDMKQSVGILREVLCGDLAVEDWPKFSETINDIFERMRGEGVLGGKVASYIPQLAKQPADGFAVAVCSTDGQRAEWGDSARLVCAQSVSKPFTYLAALEEHGEERVHNHVGMESSRRGFNELRSTIEVSPQPVHQQRRHCVPAWCSSRNRRTSGSTPRCASRERPSAGSKQPVGFDNSTYLSERASCNRNMALSFRMVDCGVFRTGAGGFPERDWGGQDELMTHLEYYFSLCSMQVSTEAAAVMAATLANGGVNPVTNERVCDPMHVRNCLSLCTVAGMYDYSGTWGFKFGVPAKSGVSGLIISVIPGQLGIATWSPPLDSAGNSVRGVSFFERLSQVYRTHPFCSRPDLKELGRKCRVNSFSHASDPQSLLSNLLAAAGEGNLLKTSRRWREGRSDGSDYDDRTARTRRMAEI